MFIRLVIMLLIYAGLNLYTGNRILRCVTYVLPACKPFIFWIIYIIICSSFITGFVFRRNAAYFLRPIGMYWIAAFVYLLIIFTVLDMLRLILTLLNRGALPPRFLPLGVGIGLCLTLALLAYGTIHARGIRVKEYDLSLAAQAPREPLRVALISDLHIGATVGRPWVARMIDAVNQTRPDIVCIAGDIFDNDRDAVADINGVAAEFRRLEAPRGVYACLGNHDVDRISFAPGSGSGDSPTGWIAAFLRDARVTLLQDAVVPVDAALSIAGRRDASPIGVRSAGRLSIRELAALADPESVVILLDHQPLDVAAAADAGIALYLSGHTHQGQFFPFNLVTRQFYKRFGARHYGYYRAGNTQAIVTSGIGLWGPPLRVATNAEVALITIRFTAAP